MAEHLVAVAVILAGLLLLDHFIAERSVQLLFLGWLVAAAACGIALRSSRAEPDWWAEPAWILGGSALCVLGGLLTLRN